MSQNYMPFNDAPSAKLATCFVTIGDRRYAMLMAKEFLKHCDFDFNR